jgi:hypothetical protein
MASLMDMSGFWRAPRAPETAQVEPSTRIASAPLAALEAPLGAEGSAGA